MAIMRLTTGHDNFALELHHPNSPQSQFQSVNHPYTICNSGEAFFFLETLFHSHLSFYEFNTF